MPAPILRTASVALLMAVALTSCTPSGSPTPDVVFDDGPTVVEIFGSEDAAAAAAEEALKAFWAASAEVYARPHSGTEPILGMTTEKWLEAEESLTQTFAEQGFVQEGAISVDSIRFHSWEGGEELRLNITACTDYSEHFVIRDDGQVAARKVDHDRFQHLVSFVVHEGELLLDDIEPRGDKQC